jgi:hypothetical protein
VADPNENYLLLKLSIQGKFLTVGAVYGPNTSNQEFFDMLERDLISLGNQPIVLGGDWNATYSTLPVDVNPDCYNMAALPNRTHSTLINNLCVNLSVSDPYRALHPLTNKFSYCPRATGATNKSRIDFFLISNCLIGSTSSCDISDSLQSSAFDHKAITLYFTGKNRVYSQQQIAGKTIADTDTSLLVHLSTLECYLIYQDRQGDEKDRLLGHIGTARNALRNAGPDPVFYKLEYNDFQE